MRTLEYIVPTTWDGATVGDFLMTGHGFSRRIITKLKQHRMDITLNHEHIRMVDTVKTDDVITVILREETHIIHNPSLFIPIVYEDDDLVVYNKPPNMPVHPSRNHQHDTLANAFNVDGATFHPINRLDRDTSGLCVVAKNSLAASKICLYKEYTAVCCGQVGEGGTIDAPIKRLDEFYIKRGVDESGQKSVTHYTRLAHNELYCRVMVILQTGRTHQIRVHFAHIGHPLAGDDMYGGDCAHITRHALCCTKVEFHHPITGEQIRLCIDTPTDMSQLV